MSTLTKRACDQCRRRKIKCDGADNCLTCRASGLKCDFNAPVLKRGPKKGSERRQKPSTHSATPSSYTIATTSEDRSSQHSLVVPSERSSSPLALGLSPVKAKVSYSPLKGLPQDIITVEPAIWQHLGDLFTALDASTPSSSTTVPFIEVTIDTCINVFFDRIFPVLPICHEPSLRASARYLVQSGYPLSVTQYVDLGTPDSSAIPMVNESEGLYKDAFHKIRSTTTLIALCALTTIFYPDMFPHSGDSQTLGRLFLRTGRTMLQEYQDYDVQTPDHSSLVIRYFLSASLQQFSGLSNMSWHVLSEACLLAKSLRIHREEVLSRYDALEATLLRRSFWALHAADQTAVVTGNRPIVFTGDAFDGCLDIRFRDHERDVALLDPTLNRSSSPFENTLLVEAELISRLRWQAATLISTMRLHSDDGHTIHRAFTSVPATTVETNRITGMYMEFSSLMDSVPPSLRSPMKRDRAEDMATKTDLTHSKDRILRLRIMFHCARCMIIRCAIQTGFAPALGFSTDASTLAMVQVDAARDFVRVFGEIPNRLLQAMGEPGWELARAVGGVLLHVLQNERSTAVQDRAKSILDALLDTLAEVNSPVAKEIEMIVDQGNRK